MPAMFPFLYCYVRQTVQLSVRARTARRLSLHYTAQHKVIVELPNAAVLLTFRACLPQHTGMQQTPKNRCTCLQEAKMLAAIRHPNVLSFLGICTTPPALISEYCARGSLFDTLRQARLSPSFAKTELTWVVRLRMVSLHTSFGVPGH